MRDPPRAAVRAESRRAGAADLRPDHEISHLPSPARSRSRQRPLTGARKAKKPGLVLSALQFAFLSRKHLADDLPPQCQVAGRYHSTHPTVELTIFVVAGPRIVAMRFGKSSLMSWGKGGQPRLRSLRLELLSREKRAHVRERQPPHQTASRTCKSDVPLVPSIFRCRRPNAFICGRLQPPSQTRCMSIRSRWKHAFFTYGIPCTAASAFIAVQGAGLLQAQSERAGRDASVLTTRMLDMGGYKLRVREGGVVVAGQPTVVFESGLGTPLENWTDVQRDLAETAATFSYDRAGLGGSDKGRASPAIAHIVEELHTLLEKSGVRPPYVLVGHSLGGAAVRLFSARYPTEVAGLVFVDPADFTQSIADQNAIFRDIGVPDGREPFNDAMMAMYRRPAVPAGVRAEAEAFSLMFEAGFPDFRTLPPAPDVPMVILLAGKYEPSPEGVVLVPGGPEKDRAFSTAWIRQRLAHMTEFARVGEPGAQGTVLLTPVSGHYIQNEEPRLVSWGIRRVLFPDADARLLAAADAGADSAVALYTFMRRTYPESTLNESTLNTLGYALMRSGKAQDALKVFQRNVVEYPNAANPHDSLGEAYMALGNRTKAIVHYERSLALNPGNLNAVARLKALRAR